MELVSNRCVDLHGRIADKRTTGGWKASHFIIVNEVTERLAFFAIAVNMVAYLVFEMHQSLPDAATHVTDWIGAAYVLTLLGAYNILIISLQKYIYFQMKFSFLNWFFFAINMGAILGITPLVYIQDAAGFGWGFGIHAAAAICSIVILLAGLRYYRFKMPMGSPFTRFLQVMVASTMNHLNRVHLENDQTRLYEVETTRKLPHTPQYRFFDTAAVMTNRWRICTVTQVEEFKSFIRVLPVWASTIALSVSYAQLSTFFLSQANIMDRTLGTHFKIPAGSVPVFSAITLILVPIYEKFIVPSLRNIIGHHRGVTSLQRMGVGLFVLIFAMASAALVERKRRDHKSLKMSVFWLLPQFFLMGAAEVFTYVGQLEFFYDEATDGTRSFS
ncbi:Peptide transporter PTR5 [Glycine soja]|nr:Peptide transporter PTR5 [Glycine soja]